MGGIIGLLILGIVLYAFGSIIQKREDAQRRARFWRGRRGDRSEDDRDDAD